MVVGHIVKGVGVHRAHALAVHGHIGDVVAGEGGDGVGHAVAAGQIGAALGGDHAAVVGGGVNVADVLEQVGQDRISLHVGIAVGVGNRSAQSPAELAGVGITVIVSIILKALVDLVIALPPLGIVFAHVLLGQLHSLAVLGVAHTVDLDAAAALAIDAVRGGGVEDDQRAVLALAQADPDVAVHGEDVAGLEIVRSEVLLLPGAPALRLGEVLGLLGGGHDVALTVSHSAVLGVHHVVDGPAHEGGAVDAAVVVLVPLLMGIVALAVVSIVLVGVVGVLALEEVDPALGQADGHGLVGGVHVLPVPGAAVDVQRGAHRFQGGGQEVLQGLLAGFAGHRGGVVLGHEGLIDGLGIVAIDHDLDGVAHRDGGLFHRSAAGLAGDLIDLGAVAQVQGLAVHGDGAAALGGHSAHDHVIVALVLQFHGGDLVGGHIDVVDIALHQLVLEAVLVRVIHSEGADVAVHEELVLEGGLVVPVGVPVAVVLDAQIYGLAFIGVKQVGQDLIGAHVGIAVGVGEGAVQVPAELAGVIASERSIIFKVLIDLIVAIPPLGIVLAHVFLGQLHSLAVLGVAHTVDLDAAAALVVDAVGGGGVEDDQRAIITLAQADPDVAVHGEDVTGLEIGRGEVLLFPSSPALLFGKILGHFGGGHDIALVAALGVHNVIGGPGHIGGAVNTSVVVLVPSVMGIVALTGVGFVLIGVISVLALEEVDPTLGQADGAGLIGGGCVLPVPGAAVDVKGGAHGLHGGGQEVLQGQLAGHAADRGGVVFGHEHPEQLGHMVIRVHHDADGIVYLQLIERDFRNSGSAGLSVDVIKFGVIIDGEGFIVNINLFAGRFDLGQNTGHIALFHLGGGDLTVINGDVVDIALLELVLDLKFSTVGGDGELFFLTIHREAVNKVFFVILGDSTVVLNTQVDNILTICLPGGGICL